MRMWPSPSSAQAEVGRILAGTAVCLCAALAACSGGQIAGGGNPGDLGGSVAGGAGGGKAGSGGSIFGGNGGIALRLDGGGANDDGGTIDGVGSTGCSTLSGTVWTPGKTDPLYNAVVYVAKGGVDPIVSGASCDRCERLSAAKAITAALTGPDGKFTLRGVPTGKGLPLVIQIGKWRRVVSVDVPSCDPLVVPDDLTRLPSNQSEGNIPLTAISTGGADSLECILRKMGIDDAEFTVPSGSGRIHMYHATGAVAATGTTPDQTELWTDPTHLKQYDMVLLPCEHAPNVNQKDPGYTNLVDYTSVGGRAFITHYNYTWIRDPSTRFPRTGQWTGETKYFNDQIDCPVDATVNMSFPKGADFAQWLVNVGASPTLGSITIDHAVHNLDGVFPPDSADGGAAAIATPWVTSPLAARSYPQSNTCNATATQKILHHYTFNTPVGASPDGVCGRVVYSAFHVNNASSDNKAFPTECTTAPLTAQEKVLMFMLFDLASCVQRDTEPPVPPIIK